jgi:hypothetical protein
VRQHDPITLEVVAKLGHLTEIDRPTGGRRHGALDFHTADGAGDGADPDAGAGAFTGARRDLRLRRAGDEGQARQDRDANR